MPGDVLEAEATEAEQDGLTPSPSRHFLDVRLAAVLIAAGVLRLSVLLVRSTRSSRFLSHDSASYLALSHDLRAYTATSNPQFSQTMERTPVYPLYLAATRAITDSAVVGPMLLQILLGTGVVYVTYRLARNLFGRPTALWAALFLAVDPLSILYSSLVLTETLFTLLLAISVLLLWRPEDNRWTRGLAAGVLLGLATLTRPVSLYLSIVLAIGFLLLERRSLRRAAFIVLSFMTGFGLVAGGWVVRNDVMGGVPTVSTIEAHNLLYYRVLGALEEGRNLPRSQAISILSAQLESALPPHPTLGQIDRAEDSTARSILLHNPAGYAKEIIKGGGRLAFGTGSTELVPATAGHATALVDAYGALYLFVLYVLVAVGLWAAWRQHRWRSCLIPLIVITYLALVSAGLDAYSRFRVPIMPFLTLLAGFGAVKVLGGWTGSKARATGGRLAATTLEPGWDRSSLSPRWARPSVNGHGTLGERLANQRPRP